MKTILIPTNFSDLARHSTDYAIKLYGKHLNRIVLLNSFEQPKTGRSIHISLVDILKKNSEKGLEEDKLRIAEEFPDLEADIITRAAQGDLSASIRSVVDEFKIDLIVMGSKGDQELLDIFIESVTARVIKNVDHPMLIVPPVADIKDLRGIILATDLKQISSPQILRELIYLCQLSPVRVNVLHVSKSVMEPSLEIEKMISGMLGNIEHDFNYRKNSNIYSGIYKFIREKDADILTLIKRKGAGSLVDRLFHKSVSHRIVKNVRQTLLLLNDQNY